jgi:hypothetical protein
MMRRSRVILGIFLTLTLAATAGWVAMGHAGPNCGSSGKSMAATGSGCAAAKSGACASASKAGACPSAMQSAQGGNPACGATMAAGMSGLMLPDGTKMTRMDVENGIDLIFTGRDLTAIRASLDEHIAACAGMDGKPCATQTCSVANTDNSVVLSVRGPGADACCTMMSASLSDNAADRAAKPAKQKRSWWKRI